MSVSLKLPRQQRRPWFRRPRPTTYRELADHLALERPGEAWDQLARSLRSLNLTACTPRTRGRCMEPLLQSAQLLQVSLEDRLTDDRFPLSPEAAEYAAMAMEVWSRLAVGYLCALRDLDGRDRQARRDFAGLGLQSLGQMLLTCYHQYDMEPAGTWRAVHECRELAVRKTNGDDGHSREAGEAAKVLTAYKQLLILAATGPLRLRQSEQSAVHAVLAHWARHVTIRPLRGAEPKGPPIVFRPGEDEAPRQYAVDQMPEAPGLRLIDPAPLAGRARRRLERIEAGQMDEARPEENLRAETLRLLITAWSGASSRQFPRSESGQAAALALGLEPAWRALKGEERPGVRCQIADRSSAGFRAVVEHAAFGLTQVGQLVAVDDQGSWILGIVRWLRKNGTRDLQLGVEAVSRQAQPVLVNKGDGTDTLHALLIEGNRAAHHPASLITPRVPLGEHARIDLHDQSGTVTLGRLLETTGSLHRYRIEEPETDA